MSGTWKDLTDNVNSMAGNLTEPGAQHRPRHDRGRERRPVAEDHRRRQGRDPRAEGDDQHDGRPAPAFAAEVTRVAREVGTEGKLGGQAQVGGVSGVWQDLTENVNQLAANLTSQVRDIADVTTAVAHGDLSQKITVEASGEIAQLASTINTMVDQLATFAAEVTRVAKEVGTEGRLGGQAEVEGVSGTWKGLTDNVNLLAATLTDAGARHRRGLDRRDAGRPDRGRSPSRPQGEVDELKDNINQMIANLRATTTRNAEQDWLKTEPRAHLGGMMQGQRDLKDVSRLIMSELTPLVAAQHGAFFMLAGRGRRGRAEPARDLRLQAAQVGREPVQAGRGPRRAGGARAEADPRHRRRPTTTSRSPRRSARRRRSTSSCCRCCSRTRCMAVHRAGVAPAVHARSTRRSSTSSPRRSASCSTRSSRRCAPRSCSSSRSRSPRELQSQSEELQAQQEELQQSNKELEEQAASLKASEELLQQQQEELQQIERGARGEGGPARGAEPADRAEERGDRARPARARGEGRAARALVAVQDRVPREHEPRAAHAAQLACSSSRSCSRDNPDANLTDEAGRVRQHDPQRGHRPARPHQRHPRPVEGRGREDGASTRRTCR